jgi:hypothetical protein
LTVNNKTIFFIVVDIFEHAAPASKRGPMKSVDITEQELVQQVESKAQGDNPSTPSPIPVGEFGA